VVLVEFVFANIGLTLEKVAFVHQLCNR